jgi:acetylornithine deacetylase/succinyl-diaminopimelate desuccinylase-like protein
MSRWEEYLKANEARPVEQLLDLLRIPSFSTDPEYASDVRRAAEWVAERLRAAGMEAVEILPTAGHPALSCSPCLPYRLRLTGPWRRMK